MATRMQQRRGTAAQWASANPILASGEIGYATDTGVIKLGDGVTAWNTLTNAYVRRAGGDKIVASGPGVIPLGVQAAVGQTANLFEVLNNAGAVIARVAPNGDFYVGANKLITADDVSAPDLTAYLKGKVSATAPTSPSVNDLWVDIS